MLTRDQIIQAEDRPSETVRVPEWGGEVRVQAMSAADRTEYESLIYQFKDDGRVDLDRRKFVAALVAFSVVDEDGKRLFGPDDVDALASKSGKALARIYSVAARLSGIGRAEEEAAEKN